MIDPELLEKHHLRLKDHEKLTMPYFAKEIPLWIKSNGSMNHPCAHTAKRYMFTKVGKTLGLDTTRFMAISQDRLFYFEVSLALFRLKVLRYALGVASWRTHIYAGLSWRIIAACYSSQMAANHAVTTSVTIVFTLRTRRR
jgi:hypothetical protein